MELMKNLQIPLEKHWILVCSRLFTGSIRNLSVAVILLGIYVNMLYIRRIFLCVYIYMCMYFTMCIDLKRNVLEHLSLFYTTTFIWKYFTKLLSPHGKLHLICILFLFFFHVLFKTK